MFHLIYTQRRRILFSGLFTALCGLVIPMAAGPDFAELFWHPVVLLVFAALCGLLAMLFWSLVLPVIIHVPMLGGFRFLAEFVPFCLFFDLAMHALVGVPYGAPGMGWYSLLIYVLVFFVVFGELLDRFGVQFRAMDRARFTSALDPDTLWQRLRTGQCDPAIALEDLIATSTPDADDPGTFDVTFRMGRGLFEHQTITYLAEEPGRHLRYHYQSAMTGPRQTLAEGIWDVTLTPTRKGRTLVTIQSEHIALEPSAALLLWFDDEHGDRLRYFANKADQRRDWTLTGLCRRELLAYR